VLELFDAVLGVDVLDLLLERRDPLVGTQVLDLSLEIGDPGTDLAVAIGSSELLELDAGRATLCSRGVVREEKPRSG
jgi:hypothetical protein